MVTVTCLIGKDGMEWVIVVVDHVFEPRLFSFIGGDTSFVDESESMEGDICCRFGVDVLIPTRGRY